MFQRLIDDFKDSTGTALRLTSLAAAAAVALFVTTGFLCAAAFVFVLQKYGPVYACLTGAGIFFVVTMIAAICYMVRKNADRETRRTDREIGRANHARRPDAGRRRNPGGARDRHQETDPDPRGRRAGAGIPGEPRAKPGGRRSAGGVARCIRRGMADCAPMKVSSPRTGLQYAAAFATQSSSLRGYGLLRFRWRRHGIAFRDLATHCARGLSEFLSPSKSEGAGNAGCALHPRSHVQWVEEVRT